MSFGYFSGNFRIISLRFHVSHFLVLFLSADSTVTPFAPLIFSFYIFMREIADFVETFA